MLRSAWQHRNLIGQMTRREVIARYRGSVLGVLWSFFNPLFMLAVYTFVFSVVFQARWAGGSESRAEFALVLFSGLILFNFLSDCLNRAPQLIQAHTNYVKKVVFPLEVLPFAVLGSALFHAAVSLGVWLLAHVLLYGWPPASAVLVPVVVLPLLILTLGLTWALAAVGPYLRDVGQAIGIVTLTMLFISPVFYPMEAVPEGLRPWLLLNPLTPAVEPFRAVLYWDDPVHWGAYLAYLGVSLGVAWGGFALFQYVRRGFADVL